MAEQNGSSSSSLSSPGMGAGSRLRPFHPTGVHRTPRTPRSNRSIVSSPSSPTSPSNGSEGSRVSLSNPRPETQRAVNEYVETPLRPSDSDPRSRSGYHSKREHGLHETLHLPISKNSLNNNGKSPPPSLAGKESTKVVTKQPKSGSGAQAPALTTFTKDCGNVTSRSGEEDWSIICKQCGKCRCEACRQPKSVPSRWLCNNFCYCSLDSCVDYGSCLCCVKALLYHCATHDGDDDTCADEPCSCGPDRRTDRWACLALTSLVLPCLWCYWPLRCIASLCEFCYARYSSRGCRCSSRRYTASSVFPQKGLLDSSPEL